MKIEDAVDELNGELIDLPSLYALEQIKGVQGTVDTLVDSFQSISRRITLGSSFFANTFGEAINSGLDDRCDSVNIRSLGNSSGARIYVQPLTQRMELALIRYVVAVRNQMHGITCPRYARLTPDNTIEIFC